MNGQTLSYHGSYNFQGNLISHHLGQPQTYFTGLSLEFQETPAPSPPKPSSFSPVEHQEQRRRRLFERTIKSLKESGLSGAELE